MARNNDRDRSTRRAPRENTRRTKKKICIFCKDHADGVDYKDVNLLRKFMSDRGKIRARRVSGNCAQHQRDVAVAIKTARELALLPYTQRTTSERPSGRGPGRGPGGGGGGGRPGGPRDSDGGGHAPAAAVAVVEEGVDLEVSDEFEAEAGGDDAGDDDGDGE
jgi:small subunit ribosomal protein S18